MSNQMTVSYHLIPDGVSTIVELSVTAGFTVSTANASKEAEAIVVQFLALITGRPAEEIRQEFQADRWMGPGWRPEEPA